MQKTILITGCSSGIGLCAAETLHKKGYRVFATARKSTDVEMLKAKGLEAIQLDVDNSESIQLALAEILRKTGGTLDALFNNAGFGLRGAVEDLTRDMMRKQFETNVFGCMELTNLVIPVMRKQGHGRIIQNTSILGVVTIPYLGAYNASKFALEAFTNTLRQELRGTNIRVSIIAPGPIETRFGENADKSYQENLADKDSVHKNVYKKMEASLKKPARNKKKFTEPASIVVEKLIHALESPAPRTRYYIGGPARLLAFLRRILPDGMLDWVLVKAHREEIKND